MRLVLRLGLFGCTLFPAFGCSLVSFDDLQDGGGGTTSSAQGGNGSGAASHGGADSGGGGSNAGGSGGEAVATTSASGGGGGEPLSPPYDWTPSMTATWRFESSAAPGMDSSPNGLDLQVSSGAPMSNDESKEGDRSLSLASAATMSSNDVAFALTSSFTFGGWFRTTSSSAQGLMGRKAPSHGYLMEHLGGSKSGKCYWEADGVITLAEGPANIWPDGTWIHFVCRYDGGSQALSTVANGVPVANVVAPLTLASTPFAIGNTSLPYEGLIDEAFFVGRALTDASLLRIYACGIDGKLCTCADGDPESYASCGRSAPECFGMPACDAPTP